MVKVISSPRSPLYFLMPKMVKQRQTFLGNDNKWWRWEFYNKIMPSLRTYFTKCSLTWTLFCLIYLAVLKNHPQWRHNFSNPFVYLFFIYLTVCDRDCDRPIFFRSEHSMIRRRHGSGSHGHGLSESAAISTMDVKTEMVKHDENQVRWKIVFFVSLHLAKSL